MSQAENPFSPPSATVAPPSPFASARPPRHDRSWIASVLLWTLICGVSAGPSFFWGLATIADQQYLAMVSGICIFIAIYTVADQLTQSRLWRHQPTMRLTLRIGYVTRLLVSVAFPIGIGVDLMCGIVSVGLVEAVIPSLNITYKGQSPTESAGFFATLLVTLIQGVTLNVVLFGYMSLVYAIVWACNQGFRHN